MSDNTQNAYSNISGFKTYQPNEIQNLIKATVNDTVQVWISKLNQLISINNVVMNNIGHENENYPFYKFGFMSAEDKVYLDYLKVHISGSSLCNIVSDVVDTSNLITKCHNKQMTIYNIDSESDKTIHITHDTNDVITINASSEITLEFDIANNNNLSISAMYSEKIVCINALADIVVNYSNVNDWHFVNNGIHPNVGIWPICDTTFNQQNEIKYNESTFLNKNNSLVLKFILIGTKVLISVIDNTQLVENYNNMDYNE